MSTNNFQSGGGTNVSSNVQSNLLGPNATGLQTFQQYQEDLETEKTPVPEEKKFGSDYISKLYNEIDFGDLPVKNETDFVSSLLYKDGFAQSIFEMQKPEASFEDFMDKIAGEVYSDKNIYIDPTIPDESRDALAKAYANPHAKFSTLSDSFLFGTDEWIKDAINSTSSGIHTNPDDPTEYVIIKDGKYRRYIDGREDSLAANLVNTAFKTVSKAVASTFDAATEILEDTLGSGTFGADDFGDDAQNLLNRYNGSYLSYEDREVTPEEFQNMSFIDRQLYGLSQMTDPETILNWDFIKSDEGIQTLSSSLELLAPGMALAKGMKAAGVVGLASKAGSFVDDAVKAAVNNGKRFSYGSQLGAGLAQVVGYTLPVSILESRMEGLGTYDSKLDLYSQETLPDGTANPDYIADETERKVAANEAAVEHFKLGIPNLLLSNAVEAATMMLPFNKLKQFGAIGGAAGVATGFALSAPMEGIEEITQWGIQNYIDEKYSVAGKEKGLQNDSMWDSLTNSYSRSLEGFSNDPEANTAFWTGIVMGGLQSGGANLAAKGKEQYYNFKYRDELNLINSSVNGGFGIYDVDDQGNKTINYEKLSGAAKHYADLTSNLHLTSNIDFSNEKTSSDKLSIMLGERYSSLVQNVLQNDTDGLLRNLPKEDFVNFMTNELNKGFRLSPEEYEKKNFQGIRYYDWNKITDNTLKNVLDDVYNLYYNQEAVKEAKDTGFEKADVLRIINESTGNKELDKVIASKSAGLAIGKSLTRNILGNYLSEETELPDDADPQDYIKGKNGYYRVMDPKNRAHVKELLNVYKKYDELYADLVAISGTNLTEENKKKQADLLNRFESVKQYYQDKKNLSKNTLGERIKKVTDAAVNKFKNRKKLDVNPLEGIFGKKKSDELVEDEAAKSAAVTEQVEAEKQAEIIQEAEAKAEVATPEQQALEEQALKGEIVGETDGFPEAVDIAAEAGLEREIPTIEEAMKGAPVASVVEQQEELTYDPTNVDSIFSYAIKAKPQGISTTDFIATLPKEVQDTFNKGIAEKASNAEGQQEQDFEQNTDNIDVIEPTGTTSGEVIIPGEPVIPGETEGEITADDLLNPAQAKTELQSITFPINGVEQQFIQTGVNTYRITPNSSTQENLLAEQSADDIGNAIAYTFTNNYFEKDNNEVFLPLITSKIKRGTNISFLQTQNDSFLRNNPEVYALYKKYRENLDLLFAGNDEITLEIMDPNIPNDVSLAGYVTLKKEDFNPIQVIIESASDATTMVHEPLWFLKRLENGVYDKDGNYTPTKAISRAINNHLKFRDSLQQEFLAATVAGNNGIIKGVITNKDFSNFDFVDRLDKATGEIVDGRILRNVETSLNKSTDSSERRVDSTFLYDEPNRDKTNTLNTKNRDLIPVIHGSEISDGVTNLTIKDSSGKSKTISVQIDKSLLSDKTDNIVVTILDDGNGGYKAYPVNTGAVSNQVKRTLANLINAFINPTEINGVVAEINKNLPPDQRFLESDNGKSIANREKLKQYISKFTPVVDSIGAVKSNSGSVTRIGLSLNTKNGTVFLGNENTHNKTSNKGLITRDILNPKGITGSDPVTNIVNLINSFDKPGTKKGILPFTAAKPSSQSYSSEIPVVDGNLVKMVKYENLVREHYYSGIEIINTGTNNSQEIGFVAQRNFILNTTIGKLPAQQTATDISETKASEIVPTPKSDVGEKVHENILDKKPIVNQTASTDIEAKKADIEKRRQEELIEYSNEIIVKTEVFEGLSANGDYQRMTAHTFKDGSRQIIVEQKDDKDNYDRTNLIQIDKNNTQDTLNYFTRQYGSPSFTPKFKKISENVDANGKNSKRFNKTNAKYDAELKALEQTTTSNQSDIEVKKADIERRRQEELNTERNRITTKTRTGRQGLDVGDKFDIGYHAIVESNDIPLATLSKEEFDKLSKEEQEEYNNNPYEVVIEVITEAKFDSNDKMIQTPVVRTASFKNKEQADAYIKERKEKLEKLSQKNLDKINAKYDAELKALETAPSTTTSIIEENVRIPKTEIDGLEIDENYDFQDITNKLEDDKAIPVSDLTFLDDLQSTIMGEIAEELLTATLSSTQSQTELDIVNKITTDKIKKLSELMKAGLTDKKAVLFEDTKPVLTSDLYTLLQKSNESGVRYFKLFKDRIKLTTQELLDIDQQKEAKLLDLDTELNEAQNRDQMNDDANRLFNPTKKVSKKEKLLYNSLVKEADPTGTGLFTTYYNYKEIKPRIISLLSIGNDNYYEPNTKEALDILRNKDFGWIQPLMDKLTNVSKYDPELMEVMKQQVLVFNRNLEANYMQIYVDYKTENAGTAQEYKTTQFRVGPITADFNRREVVMDIIDTIGNLNGVVPDAISNKEKKTVSEILDSISFDLTGVNTTELNNVIKNTRYLKDEIKNITLGEKVSTSNIRKVADFISTTRKTPQLSQLDNAKTVSLFVTPSQMGEDLAKFINSNTDAKLKAFSHTSAKDTLAFFKPGNDIQFGTAALAFRSGEDTKLSEFNKMEYAQAAFNMFFSEENEKSWYISATPSDGGTNYLIKFSNIKIKNFRTERISDSENAYYYDNLIKPDLDRMSAPFIHDGSKVYSLANHNPMKFYGFEKLYTDGVIQFSDNTTAEESYARFLQEINAAKTDKKKVEIATRANEYFRREIEAYSSKEDNKLRLVNLAKESMQELSDNIRKDLSDTGLLLSMEEFAIMQKSEPNKAKQYSHGIHRSLIDKVSLEEFSDKMLGYTGDFQVKRSSSELKNNKSFSAFIQEAMLSTIVGNYAAFHNNMQYIFQGDPSLYAKGYDVNDPQGSYDNFLGNLFKRLKSNISPRDIGNDKVKAVSKKGLKAMKDGKFNSSNPEHTYERTHVNHIIAKDIKIPGLNLSGILDVMGSDLSYDRFEFNPGIITKEKYEALSTKEKLDTILANVDKPERFFPEAKDHFSVAVADAQEYWHYTYGLDFLEEQGEITNQKKLDIIQRVESDTLTKDDYKYLGVQKPLHVGTRNISDNNGNTIEGNNWQIRDYIKSSAKFLYPQLVKGTEWEDIYNNMEKNNVDAITFDSAVKVGGPSNPVNIFSPTGEYTGVNLTDITVLSSKFKGKQLNIPLKEENKIADPAQPDAKFGPGLENLTLEDGTSMKVLISEMESAKRDKREIEKEKIRKRLSNSDGTLNIKKLHDYLQEELNSRGFENNAKDIVTLMQEIDPDGEIIDILMYPLHAMTQPKRFDALIASLVTKAGISKGKTPGFGLPQVASIGFKSRKAKVNEIQQIGNRSIVTVGGWDISKGLSHYTMGTEHNPRGLAEIIVPWLFPSPIENFTEDGTKYGKIDLNKLPEELLEGLGFRIPYQNYSSSMGFKIVGFTTDPNSVFVPHEIASQMGSDYDIDKLYGMLPDIEAVYDINGRFNNKAQVESRLNKVQESINEILEDMLTIGEKTGKLETLKDQIDNSEVSTDTIDDVIDQIKNSPGKKLILLTEQLEQLQEVLAKEAPDAFRKSNSRAGKVNNKIHDIRMRIISHPEVKKKGLQALDTGINEWFDWFNSTLRDSIESTNSTKSYLDFNYQGSKSDNARVGKKGIGAFSLNGSTISKFSGKNVTLGKYLPIAIEYRDENNNVVRAINDDNLSHKYDILSNQKLREIFDKGFEGKQLVSYLDENGENQYALLDLYEDAKIMKSYMDNIFTDLVDPTNTGIETVLADNDVVTEMLNEYNKDNEDTTLFSKDIIEQNKINYTLKAVDILQSDKAKQIFEKGNKAKWSLDKILTELQVSKEQKQLLLDLNITDREQLALELASKYSYTVEINTVKEKTVIDIVDVVEGDPFSGEKKIYSESETPTKYYYNLSAPGGTGRNKYEGNSDWEYQELEFKTPLITPSIKGHAQFATEQGIGWARVWYNKKTGVVEIQEVQSDLFQKGRDSKDLISGKELQDNYNSQYNDNIETFYDTNNNRYFKVENGKETTITEKEFNSINSPKESSKNQFLQLLNKDNNWVTFFVKSIIQDSAKKGYEKVLFPRLDTIIQIESAGKWKTYEEAEKAMKDENWKLEDEELRKTLKEYQEEFEDRKIAKKDTKKIEQAIINQKERIRSHQPTLLNTANFYEYELANRLDDIVGGNKNNRAKGILVLNQITDEYGNTWNEVEIESTRDTNSILFSKDVPGENVKPTVDLSREWKGDLESRPVYTDEGVNTMRTTAAQPSEHFGNPFSEAGYGNTVKARSVAEAVQMYKDWLLNDYATTKDYNLDPKEFVKAIIKSAGGKPTSKGMFAIDGQYYYIPGIDIMEKPYGYDAFIVIGNDELYLGSSNKGYTDFVSRDEYNLSDLNYEQQQWILNQINQGKLDGANLLYAGKLAGRGEGMHPTALAEVVEELRGAQIQNEEYEEYEEVTDSVYEKDGREIKTHFELSSDQKKALDELIDFTKDPKQKMWMLQGAAGTGKTSIIGYLQNYLGEDFLYLAPTHAATVQLAFSTWKTGNRSLPITVRSSMKIEKLTGQVALSGKAKEKIGLGRIIVVDETSMLAKSDYNNLKELVKRGYKLIFMGDKKQIPEVTTTNANTKNVSDAFVELPTSNLDKIHRTSNNKLKSVLQNTRDSTEYQLFQPSENTQSLTFYNEEVSFNQDLRDTVLSDPENTMYIGYTNNVVKGKNAAIRKLLGRSGVVKENDIVTGYLGYASKQIEKGNLANSVNFTIKGITEINPGQFKLNLESKKLSRLKSDGFDEIPSNFSTRYLPLSDKDSLETTATDDQYLTNNQEISKVFQDFHAVYLAYLKNPKMYGDYLDAQQDVSAYFMKVDLGYDYIYDPSLNSMLPYDKYNKSDKTLQEVAKRNNLLGQNGQFNTHFDKLKVEKGIDYGHAITIHKSQGSTIDNVFFDASTIPSNNDTNILEDGKQISTERQSLAYVGLSRSSKKLSVYTGTAPFETVDTSAISEFDPIPEPKLRKKQTKPNQTAKKDSTGVAGFYDGERIVLNKDHKDFGIGKAIHEHMHPLLNDLDSIIAGTFDGQDTTKDEKDTAIAVKQKLFMDASEILGEDVVMNVLTSEEYSNISPEQKQNEIIARAVEKVSVDKTKNTKSFMQSMKDFIKFLLKNVKSRFYKAVIQDRSFTAKDLEPIVGISELADVYLVTGAAKRTMDKSGKLREATATDKTFDSVMEQIRNKGKVLNVSDNSSFQEFSTNYNHSKGYNQVIEHEEPKLVDKSYNNTVYENITVDGANKVAELEASGLNPDTLNIATSMTISGFDPKHVTIALNNPMLKEYFTRLKAKEITEGWSISNQADTLTEMKLKYLPNSAINTDLSPSNFYTSKKDPNGNTILEPNFVISEDMMFDKKAAMFNKDRQDVSEQNSEVLEHQFRSLLVTLSFGETNKDLIGLANLFNLNSSGGTRSFNNDSEIYDNIKALLETNKFGNYDLGSVLDENFTKQVFENFIEIRDLFTSEKGISAVIDHKSFVDDIIEVYGVHYTVGEYTPSKRRKFRDKLVNIIPEYVKAQVFSKIPTKDNLESTKFRLLSNDSTVNLAGRIASIKEKMLTDKSYPLNIEKVFFEATEVKREAKYSLVKFNGGRISPDVKNNITTNLTALYNVPVDLGFSDGYTSKDLIDDLFDYSIVTGANTGPGKFFDYLPSKILLRDFAKFERDFEFPVSNRNNILISFLMNNPDLLPGLETLPKDYTGRIFKTKTGDIFLVNRNPETKEASVGKKLDSIIDKTFVKQYTLKTSLKEDVLTVSGYNVLTGSDAPQIYQKDTNTEDQISTKSLADLELLAKDSSQSRLVSKHAIGENIGNKELKAAYQDLMLDADVQSVGIVITDMIDSNPNNYARYNKDAHIITVSRKALESGKYSLSGILIHEYTHVVMSDMVRMYENIKNGSLSKDVLSPESYDKMRYLESVFETYREEFPKDLASMNLDEFISEVRRSSEVRDKITKLPDSKKKNILTRILNSITDLIKEIFGLSPENNTISGQQILDATLDFITTLGKSKTTVRTNGTDTYTFTTSRDNNDNIIRLIHGTKNGETLVNLTEAYNEVIKDPTYSKYFLSDAGANVIYKDGIERKTTSSYNLSVPEFNAVMKTTKTLMKENEYEHDALMDIIKMRFYNLVKTAEINKTILRTSKNPEELAKALDTVNIIEEELKRIQEHIVKATKAENTKEKMDYVDSVIDAVQDVVNSDNPSVIEVLTANHFLTKLTEVFDHTKTDISVYSPDGVNDLTFINEEAKNDPEINLKYHEQVTKIVDLNSKLLGKTFQTIDKLMKQKDEFINTDFESKYLKEEIGAFNKWLMTPDRSGDPLLNSWSYLSNDVESHFKLEIATKIEQIKVAKEKAVPALQLYYAKLTDRDLLSHHDKYGTYSLFLDENGNFKTRYKKEFFDVINKAQTKRDNAQKEYVADPTSDNLKALKKAKKAYADVLSKSSYSLKSDIEADLAKETDPTKIKEFTRALEKFDKMRADKLDKFEVDLAVYINSLEKHPDKAELTLEFIEEYYPAISHSDLKEYVKSKTKQVFEYKIEKGSVMRNDSATLTPIKEVNKSYEYHHSVPKPGYWNDMDFLDNPDIKGFYDLYTEMMKEIIAILPKNKGEALNLSQIPFIARELLDYSLKDMVTNPGTRKTVITDYVQKLVLRENYISKNDTGQSYDNEAINTRFGKTNAFSKETAIKERLIKRLTEEGLPIYDSLGKLNPHKANKVKGAYTKEFTKIYKEIKDQVELELADMKSFDLGLVLEMYYMEAMMYKHKMNQLNEMNLIKDTAMKSWQNVKDSNGQPAPLQDKMQMLLSADKIFKGIPARISRGDGLLNFTGKRYSNLERRRKEDLENSIEILKKDLEEVSLLEENEENLIKRESILQEIKRREDEINNLGGYLHVGNIMRQLMQVHTFIRLGFNASSSVGNTLMGITSNRMEAADGRIFNMDSYNKIFNKIYKKSSLTPFLAGTFAGIAVAPFSLGLGAIVGYGVNRLLTKTRTPDPDTVTILNMMGMYDLVQEQGRELQLKTESTRKSKTWSNKLMRTDAAEILRSPMLFINKSEIPHQATILGSILDSTKISLSEDKEQSLLDLLTSIGSDGMKFNADYNQIVNLKLNTVAGTTITEVPLGVLLNRVATTAAALSAKTHGNYRLNVKQLAKLDDLTVLGTEFKTWAFEGFYNRYEDAKPNITISKSLTSTENQLADQDYITKGMYQTGVEKLGVPLTFGLNMFTPNINSLLMGAIGTFSGAGIFSALPAVVQAGGTLYALKHLHAKRYEKNVNPNVQKAFVAALAQRAARSATMGKAYKKFADIEIDGVKVNPQEYLNDVLSVEDAANLRKLIEQSGVLVSVSLLYYLAIGAKLMVGSDDEDDVVARRYTNFVMNTMGRTMLDIESYTAPGDIWDKYGAIEKIAPTTKFMFNIADVIDSAVNWEKYEASKKGQYEKGDLKFIKQLERITPAVNQVGAFTTKLDQELEMFNANK